MIASLLLLSNFKSIHDEIQAPTLTGFKSGARKVKVNPENGGYQVFQIDGQLKVLTRVEWVKWDHSQRPNKYPRGTIKVIEPQAYREYLVPGGGMKFQGGRLYTIDNGEWGGGIYFVPSDRNSYKRISERNTCAIGAFGNEVYAFQSLAHMMFSYADLVQIKHNNSKWQIQTVKRFTSAPRQVDRDGNHFVLLNHDDVVALWPDGKQNQILDVKAAGENFWCMTILANGQIWLGSDSGVTALVPKSDGTYKSFSYIPRSSKN